MRTGILILLIVLLASPAPAQPIDACGEWVEGTDGCTLFQPDASAERYLVQNVAPGPVGTRVRITGNIDGCISFCFTDCIYDGQAFECVPPCAVDFDGDGQRTIGDIFAFLTGWFVLDPLAEWDGDGEYTIRDIFGFLTDWFIGCT